MPDETGILHRCDAPGINAAASKSTVQEAIYFESDSAGSVFMSDETGTHIICQCDVPDTSVTTPKSTLPVTHTKSTEIGVRRFYLGSGKISKHGKEKGEQSSHIPIKKLIAQTALADATIFKRGKRILDGEKDSVRKSGRQPVKAKKNTDFINY